MARKRQRRAPEEIPAPEAPTIAAGKEREWPPAASEPPLIVGIGASAGGLAALQHFFAGVPADSGLAYVVVVHLSAEHESHLAEVLQRFSPIPVEQVTATIPLEPNRAYVIPPGRNLTAIDSHIRPTRFLRGGRQRAPIDHFFTTLAATYDGHAVGVILSGSGADGTLGIRRIKESGGIALVQDPDEAEYDSMPRSAISTGVVDGVLGVREMATRILEIARARPRVPRVSTTDAEDAALEREDEQKIEALLLQVRARTGQDFSGYKRSTILRRLHRRMQLRALEEMDQYLDLVRRDHAEAEALASDLLINVTNFFRDPEVFERLAADVVPRLFAERASDRIRLWSIGCATGEEAYSLAMLLLEEADAHARVPLIQVFASDLHAQSLEYARQGLYPETIETHVSPERLQRFFTREAGGYRVKRELRDLVVFASHNVLRDPPFTQIDLLSARNVLIYLQRDVQRQLFGLFHYALSPAGYLLLGSAESAEGLDFLRLVDKEACLYQARSQTSGAHLVPVFPVTPLAKPVPDLQLVPPARRDPPLSYGALHQRVVEQYAPPSLLVSEDHGVVHYSRSVGRYLRHPGGTPTNNVFSLVREELRPELRAALNAVQTGGSWRSKPVVVDIEGRSVRVALHVRAPGEQEEQGFFLVIFDELEDGGDETAPAGTDPTVNQLDAELQVTRERLQSVIEEYEAGREEMKASNEELLSMNEELRSTMEELETSKEELQSVNEELQTVNDENRHRVEELSQLTADLQNLLKSTDIATLFLDRGLRILRFTPSVTGIFNVRSADRGRPLADLNHRLNYQGLIEDAARVLDRLIPVENEVEAQDGRSYLLRILPYRTADDRIDGVVITFIDISALKRSQAELRELNETLEQRVEERTRRLRESEARFQALVHASAQIVWTADPDGVVVEDSPSWRAFTGQRLEDWLGEGWLDAVHRDDRDGAQREWRGAVDARAPLDTEFRIAQLGGDWRCMRVRAVPLYDDARLTGWVGMMTDVTEARDAEEQLRETRARLAVVEQDERHRIATILHDDLQQRLFAIQLKIATLRNGLERGDDADRLGRLFQEANEWIDEAIQMTRRLSVDLSPPVLRGDGLEDALLWLLEQMRERHRLEVELDLDGGVPELDDEMRVLVFHVVRELLFNVVKHAGATTARVDIRRDADDLVVRVSDQGGGFEAGGLASSGLPRNGFGLFNIRDRLLLLGGAMEIESSPGAGTRVALRVPLEGRGPAR